MTLWGILLILGMIYGFAVAADSAIYSTGLTELADPRTLGSSQAIHTFFAFGAGVFSPVIAGGVLDLSPMELSWGLGDRCRIRPSRTQVFERIPIGMRRKEAPKWRVP